MSFTTRPELVGTYGMVSSTHWLASATAMRVLERGGNAFDAAVASGFVLQVVEPHLNGPAGEAVLLVFDAEAGETVTICGQGPSPQRATVEAFEELGLSSIPGTGLLAACVPGAFDAWLTLLQRYGTASLREVLEPAIGYAANGYPLVPKISAAIAASQELFETEWTSSAEVYLAAGRVPRPGSVFRNRDLARTYASILETAEKVGGSSRDSQIDAARDSFYRGFVAERIDAFVTTPAMDTSGVAHAGLLRADDLHEPPARVERPVSLEYEGRIVHKAGPWSQGPVFLQQLALLRGFELGAMDHNGPEYIHTIVECAKLAFADREAWYGDPDVVPDRTDELLSAAYNDARRGLVTPNASFEIRPGRPGGEQPHLLEGPDDDPGGPGSGEPTLSDFVPPEGDTCQVDVVDAAGNMVAATPSGAWLQSSPVVPGLGFGLGSRLQMFWLDPTHPSGLRPGVRPRTTLTPTIVTRDGSGELAFGTPGGDRQDQWSLQLFLSVVHHGLNLQQAIDAPAFNTDHVARSFYPRRSDPGSLLVEGRLDASTVDALRHRGHDLRLQPEWSLGRLSAVGRDADTGLLRAGANARGMQSYAAGR